ncbi:MAG TPA: L-rhamnose mutarotase [Puia sp.]|jgi:L-rhamnose mutarotase|nr:L-rhamnose mutarotase [Puia sp.]
MQRIAFTMKLKPGFEQEYRRRHEAIWPDLAALLHETGIREYSIFFDEATLTLFAYLRIDKAERLDDLPAQPVMQRWWAYMHDIMDTHPDHSPVTTPLNEVFHLP